MFQYCIALSDVDIGIGLKVIPESCFCGDSNLEKIILPRQITTVEADAFKVCIKLTDITMNRNITSIDETAFSYRDKLTIYGISGTYPEIFAKENNIKFVELNVPATAIELNKSEYKIARGGTLQLAARIVPMDPSDELIWTSTDETIVTIGNTGLMKGIKTGTASILVMAGNVVETCKVIVYEKVTKIVLNSSSEKLDIGGTVQLIATVKPDNAESGKVKWSTSDEKIATVDENGLVTAVAYGTTKITATTEDNQVTATCTITVQPIAVTGIALNETMLSIGLKESYQLTPIFSPENASVRDVTWTSSRTEIATVRDGMVTGISEGTAVIVAKTEDGSKTATCTVTVTKHVISANPPDKTAYNTDTVTVKVTVQDVTKASYQMNDKEKVEFTDSAEITFGGDTTYGEQTTITVTGISKTERSPVSKTFTYTREKVSAAGVAGIGLYIRVKKLDFVTAPQIYIYDDTHTQESAYTGKWSGKTMTVEGDYYI